jgi:hypothetical protein
VGERVTETVELGSWKLNNSGWIGHWVLLLAIPPLFGLMASSNEIKAASVVGSITNHKLSALPVHTLTHYRTGGS